MIEFIDETIDDICDYIKNNKEILLFILMYLIIKNIFMFIYDIWI